jgi:hypothetical protein
MSEPTNEQLAEGLIVGYFVFTAVQVWAMWRWLP